MGQGDHQPCVLGVLTDQSWDSDTLVRVPTYATPSIQPHAIVPTDLHRVEEQPGRDICVHNQSSDVYGYVWQNGVEEGGTGWQGPQGQGIWCVVADSAPRPGRGTQGI